MRVIKRNIRFTFTTTNSELTLFGGLPQTRISGVMVNCRVGLKLIVKENPLAVEQ